MDKQKKGENKQVCVGPCVSGNKPSIHPIYLEIIAEPNQKPYCPTKKWEEKTKGNWILDICENEDDMSKIDKRDITLLYAIPKIGFECKEFLETYYELYSFESVAEWLSQNSENNIYTKLRVIGCAWSAYGNDKNPINDQIIDFYIDVIKKIWIRDIYNSINKYINIDKSGISFKEINKDAMNKNKVEKINFFLEKFNTRSVVYSVIQSYINSNKNKWKDIKNHNNELKKYYINYVISKIKATL